MAEEAPRRFGQCGAGIEVFFQWSIVSDADGAAHTVSSYLLVFCKAIFASIKESAGKKSMLPENGRKNDGFSEEWRVSRKGEASGKRNPACYACIGTVRIPV